MMDPVTEFPVGINEIDMDPHMEEPRKTISQAIEELNAQDKAQHRGGDAREVNNEDKKLTSTIGTDELVEPKTSVQDVEKDEAMDILESNVPSNAREGEREAPDIVNEDRRLASAVDEKIEPELKEEEDEVMDVLGSGQLLKKILEKGDSKKRPERTDRVTTDIQLFLEGGGLVEEYRDFSFSLGDNEIVQGLDLAIPLMERGEKAEITVDPRFGFGELGRPPDIPKNATLKFTIHLKDFGPEPDPEGLPLSERMTLGTRRREKGNFWFSRGEYSFAVQCYRKALDLLDDNTDIADPRDERPVQQRLEELPPEVENILQERVKTYNNLAAAQMKLEAYEAAIRSLDAVLMCEPENVKALFRKGKVLGLQGKTSEALDYLRKANKLDPSEKMIHNELSRILGRRKAERQEEKSLYRNMLREHWHSENSSSSVQAKQSKSSWRISWKVAAMVMGAMTLGFTLYKWRLGPEL